MHIVLMPSRFDLASNPRHGKSPNSESERHWSTKRATDSESQQPKWQRAAALQNLAEVVGVWNSRQRRGVRQPHAALISLRWLGEGLEFLSKSAFWRRGTPMQRIRAICRSCFSSKLCAPVRACAARWFEMRHLAVECAREVFQKGTLLPKEFFIRGSLSRYQFR